jgi:hypothetical protein
MPIITGTDLLAEAAGRRHRADPVLPGAGGPAGNARLTAWTGLVLLVLFCAELVTLLDVTGLVRWHVALGAALIGPALLKTATTGWRMVQYYTGSRPYRAAGPPPAALRLLGPLVVLSTLGLLGSGVVLVPLGPDRAHRALVTALGQRVDWVTLHQAVFAVWVAVTGLHVLARLIPAVRLTGVGAPRADPVPGRRRRGVALAAAAAAATVGAAVLLAAAGPWQQDRHRPYPVGVRYDHR